MFPKPASYQPSAFSVSASREQTGLRQLARPARLVEQVAHHWAALRITAASARQSRAAAAPNLTRRINRLLDDTERALESLASAGAARTTHTALAAFPLENAASDRESD